MKFEITILGSGSALPTLQRNPTAHFVECNNRFILIDCAEGTQIQLRKFKVKFQKIDVILISHLHGDHYFGLVGLLSSMHLLGRDKKLLVVGPEHLEALIRPQLEVGGHQLNYVLEFKALPYPSHEVVFEDKKIEIKCFPLLHRIPTHGYQIAEKTPKFKLNKIAFDAHGLNLADIPKIKEGFNITLENGTTIPNETLVLAPETPKKYAYCSDTKYSEKIVPYILAADLLYHEATFIEEQRERAKQTFHSTAGDAAKIAKQAGVKKLIIGHFSSRYQDFVAHSNEASAIFSNTILAEDGMVVRL
jgi:ribonuclease Z